MQKRVFLSCSSKDRKIALTICAGLEVRGHKCWISSRDVRPGQNFQESIVRAIREAGVMVLIFSANANNSDEIKKEIALAGQSRLMVIPVRVEDVTPSEAFSYEMATRQWVDLFDNWEQAMDQLVGQIDSVIPPEASNAPAPALAVAPVKDAPAAPSRMPLFAGALAVLLLAGGAAAFFLTQKPAAPPPAIPVAAPMPQAAAPDPAAMEKDAWDSVRDSGDTQQLQTYLDKYPKGMFADIARAKIASLVPAKIASPAPPKSATVSKPAALKASSRAEEAVAAPPKETPPVVSSISSAPAETPDPANLSGSANRPGRPAVAQGRQAYAQGNYAEAMEHFQKAASLDNPAGEYNIGVLYENGQGVAQNWVTAAQWYQKAAAQNNAAAEYNLGLLYQDGKGMPRDYAQAMQWFEKAAGQGHILAEVRIGYLYQFGEGVPKDTAEAAEWYQKAASRGNLEAQAYLTSLRKN